MHTDRLSPAPRLLPLGDAAWTVEFGRRLDPATNDRVMRLAERVQALRGIEAVLASVQEVVPTLRSLTVHFDPLHTDADGLGARLLALCEAPDVGRPPGRRWRLPVCFEPAFAPDLAGLATACGLNEGDVVRQLLGARLRVCMIGFMPGFPYLSGLPSTLSQPRLATPRKAVPAQSLAVAGEMCCVYPWESPGGWRLLGHVPLPMFERAREDQPAWLRAGDEVQWVAVGRDEHDRLAAEWAGGSLGREAFLMMPDEAAAP